MPAKTQERTRKHGSIRAEGDRVITCQQTNLENGVRSPEWDLTKPSVFRGLFRCWNKKRGGPFFCAIAMLKKDFRYIKINKKIPQKSAE